MGGINGGPLERERRRWREREWGCGESACT